MSLAHILLGLCARPRSGYDLKQEVDQYVRHFWPAELSQIYPTLRKMQGRGWLTVSNAPSRRGPERRVYQLTDEGREELRRWLRSGLQVGTERLSTWPSSSSCTSSRATRKHEPSWSSSARS